MGLHPIRSVVPDRADRRIGVLWHTTGSGKSLSMAFLVGILRRRPELENATFVIQVDRNDLDNQIHDQFVATRSLVGDVKLAETVDELRDMLRTEGGEVIFTTIEKFQLKADRGESEHPVLSERSNIVVIADEAHRSQYWAPRLRAVDGRKCPVKKVRRNPTTFGLGPRGSSGLPASHSA